MNFWRSCSQRWGDAMLFLSFWKEPTELGFFCQWAAERFQHTRNRGAAHAQHNVSRTLQSPSSCFFVSVALPLQELNLQHTHDDYKRSYSHQRKGRKKEPQREGCRVLTPSATNGHGSGVWGVNINIQLAATASHNRHEHWLEPVLVMVLGNHPCSWLPEGSSDPLLVLSVSLFDLQMNCFW